MSSIEKNNKCEYCKKLCSKGYDLYCFLDRDARDFKLMHFCSTHCLSRWVGDNGWLYESYHNEFQSDIKSNYRTKDHILFTRNREL
jgi:hypothetical protein